MAVEYVFWEERLPEILVRFGEPLKSGANTRRLSRATYWTDLFEQKLEATQDALSIEAQRRDPPEFQTVLRGGAGQGGIYDLWRAFKAKFARRILPQGARSQMNFDTLRPHRPGARRHSVWLVPAEPARLSAASQIGRSEIADPRFRPHPRPQRRAEHPRHTGSSPGQSRGGV